MAPESPVWKERGRGRLRMLDRAWKDEDGVELLSISMAAIVCRCVSEYEERGMEECLHLSHAHNQRHSCTSHTL